MKNKPADLRRVPNKATAMRFQHGAALLMMLVLGGLAMSILLISAYKGRRLEAEREKKTLISLSAAREALLGYAVAHGRLPRPALVPAAGLESPTPCTTDETCTGFLPWATLGLEAGDAWGRLLRYSVTPAFTTSPISAANAIANKRIYNRNSSGRLIPIVGQTDCSQILQCAPAVIYSSGGRNQGMTIAGIRQGNQDARNLDEQINEAGKADFIMRARADEASVIGGQFDDIVSWLPLNLLYRRMTAGQVLQ